MFSQIDDLNRSDHYRLQTDDRCYFLREYTSRKPYTYSETNQLIKNLKKPMDRRGRPEWKYKLRAISTCANELYGSFDPRWLEIGTLVPVPPSKARSDPGYDDRILRVLQAMGELSRIRRPDSAPLDVRELVVQTQSTQPDHTGEQRRDPELIASLYVLDSNLLDPAPREIGIVDDVLTNGAHFRAMSSVLRAAFPEATVYGFFIARRIFPDPFEGMDLSGLELE